MFNALLQQFLHGQKRIRHRNFLTARAANKRLIFINNKTTANRIKIARSQRVSIRIKRGVAHTIRMHRQHIDEIKNHIGREYKWNAVFVQKRNIAAIANRVHHAVGRARIDKIRHFTHQP